MASITQTGIKDAIKARFNTEIEVAHDVLVQYDNVTLDNPDDALWVRLSVLFGTSDKKSIGSLGANVSRHPGVVMVQIFAPIGKGDKDSFDLVDKVKAAFVPGTYSNVTYRTGSVVNLPREGSWFRTNFNIPFIGDELA